mgnify:CR=1 FL=1
MSLTDRDRVVIDEAIKLMKKNNVYLALVKERTAISINGNRGKVEYKALYGTEDERDEIGEAYGDMCAGQDYGYECREIGSIQFHDDHEDYIEREDW